MLIWNIILWAIWKVRKNMNADMKWLDNPEVFKVNQLEPHSDHSVSYTHLRAHET